MTSQSQPAKAQSVQVVEADIFDRMNETDASIAQRAYEIFQSRGGGHGSDREDWFRAEQEILPPLAVERYVTDSALRLTAQVPGFKAKDLEISIGHRRAVICGVRAIASPATGNGRKNTDVMRIVEFPFDVDPALTSATLQSGTLQILLPRFR